MSQTVRNKIERKVLHTYRAMTEKGVQDMQEVVYHEKHGKKTMSVTRHEVKDTPTYGPFKA